MKQALSFFLVLIIITSIVFQCSFNSCAVFGVDDALLVATVCLDLASMGITIYSVSEFCKSDAFRDFCSSIGNSVQNGVSIVKRNGKIFLATTSIAWNQFTSWAKSKFSGISGRFNYKFMTSGGTPSSITLSNGTTIPYGEFMQYAFFLYKSGTTYHAYCCTGLDPGATFSATLITIYCEGTGKVQHWVLNGENGSWTRENQYNMTYGASYKGTTGSLYNINYGTGAHMDNMNLYLYRTMPKILNHNGEVDTASPPANSDPDEPQEVSVPLQIDSTMLPGSVSSPVSSLSSGELYMIEAPSSIVVGADTDSPSITTDTNILGNTLSSVTPSNVNSYVLTDPVAVTVPDNLIDPAVSDSIEDVIADTDTPSLEAEPGETTNDIDTANKFRLPRSFLEGFPFSIPYSVFVGIKSFLATPTAPFFSFPFRIPLIGINENIVIDLSQWDSVAKLCRALLSVVWVAGLAMACNKFLKR